MSAAIIGLPRTDAEKLQVDAVAFLTLTLPVALYVALFEASRSQASRRSGCA